MLFHFELTLFILIYSKKFSLDNLLTKGLLILLSFYFHEVLAQLILRFVRGRGTCMPDGRAVVWVLVKEVTSFWGYCYLNSHCIRKSITLMFMSSSRDEFTPSLQKEWQMFLWVSGQHVGAHPDGNQHDISIQSSINLGKPFLQILRICSTVLTWFLTRVFAYLTLLISQNLNFIYWTAGVRSFRLELKQW